MANPRQCFEFQANGRCKWGTKCKFAHGNSNRSGSAGANGKPRPSPPTDSFCIWRLKALPPRPGLVPKPIDLAKFFAEGLQFVQEDYARVQDTILLLAADGGLLRVRELLEQTHKFANTTAGVKYLQEQLLPFFETITHPNVQNSPLLEKPLTDVYNIIYGPHGYRATAVFEGMVSILATRDCSAGQYKSQFETVLDAFAQVTLYNGSANVNSELTQIAAALVDKVISLTNDFKDSDLNTIKRLAHKLNRHFKIGREILLVEQPASEHRKKKAKYIQQQEPPGGRHDNDYADIRQIQILPTKGEIQSSAQEFLPTIDGSHSDLRGFEALIDRHFRLLREDTIGQLRDAIRSTLQPHGQSKDSRARSGPQINVYDDLRLIDMAFLRGSGIEIFVSVKQPRRINDATKRREMWNRSKKLQRDALVCLTDIKGSHIFCTVSAQGPPIQNMQRGRQSPEHPSQTNRMKKYGDKNLHSQPDRAYLTLKPVSKNSDDLSTILRYEKWSSKSRLVEFPGILLPAFEPTLTALKKMLDTEDMPFMTIIAADSRHEAQLLPPPYAREPGFSFDLACLTKTRQTLPVPINGDFNLQSLLDRSTLDEAQAKALIHSLGTSLSLIQGPPGTGKSFTGVALIKVLLAAKKKARLGPILCVCYTNHALDQLLEHLHEKDVTQIIRVGSRSKSEVLEEVNLRKIARETPLTSAEKHSMWQRNQEFDDEVRQASHLLDKRHKAHYVGHIKDHIKAHNTFHYSQLFDESLLEEGFQEVKDRKSDPLQRWVNEGKPSSPETQPRSLAVLQKVNLNSMTLEERKYLYESWITEVQDATLNGALVHAESYQRAEKQFEQVRGEIDLRCLQAADIVGLTTSGLARNIHILRKLRAKVLVCEEAGEVLESHLLTALLPSVEHAILIGDHQQLRPQVQNYDLSRESSQGAKFSLDVSLFERLVEDPTGTGPKIPYCTLEIQRRMHPSISRLIHNTLYPNLIDGPDVCKYPPVVGMARRLFWFDHVQPEDSADSDDRGANTSHSNSFEVNMVTSLISHFVRQGTYKPGEIAVLTPYLGQFFKLRAALGKVTEIAIGERDVEEATRQGYEVESESGNLVGKSLKGTLAQSLRIATIDNFQGEEAKVIVISLVRSNEQKRIGFLKTSNRINVLLSRAQHGMYIVGNSDTASSVKMWSQVIGMLREEGNIGEALELQCPRHPEMPLQVSNPEDFVAMSPEGGCGLMCEQRLLCGHPCHKKCHSSMLHEAVHCLEPCPRSLPGCDHSCPNDCGSRCVKKCGIVLSDEILNLPCGHQLPRPTCWQYQHAEKVLCQIQVQKKVPGCEHIIMESCYQDVTADSYLCTSVCSSVLLCGHKCLQRCSRCLPTADRLRGHAAQHSPCKQRCGRHFNACTHICSQICHEGQPCAPCSNGCEMECTHSKCNRKCNEPCAPCAQTSCPSICPHSQCTLPCAAPCDWLPCGKRCPKLLSCGHQCPSLCGEMCPTEDLCQFCASDKVKDLVVDMLEMETYCEIDLDDDPCIIPPCGHILTMKSMDGVMGMKDFYELSDTGGATGLKAKAIDLTRKIPVCPTCRGSLRNIDRYGRIVREALLAESTKKFITWSNAYIVPLTQQIQNLQEELFETTDAAAKAYAITPPATIHLGEEIEEQIRIVRAASRSDRYDSLMTAYKKATKYARAVAKAEQPFRRVWELVQHKRRMHGTDGSNFKWDTGVLQTRQYMMALSLMLRCQLAVLCDFISLAGSAICAESKFDFSSNRKVATQITEMAKEGIQPGVEAEGYIFYARFCAVEQTALSYIITRLQAAGGSVAEIEGMRARILGLKEVGLSKITEARDVCYRNKGSSAHLTKELDQVEKMVQNSTLSDILLPEEMKAVYDAMAQEFRGTGHWYYCANGHLFTIGECGMPMQLARCPQCNAPIGGQHHQTAQGVSSAQDLERRMQNMSIS